MCNQLAGLDNLYIYSERIPSMLTADILFVGRVWDSFGMNQKVLILL